MQIFFILCNIHTTVLLNNFPVHRFVNLIFVDETLTRKTHYKKKLEFVSIIFSFFLLSSLHSLFVIISFCSILKYFRLQRVPPPYEIGFGPWGLNMHFKYAVYTPVKSYKCGKEHNSFIWLEIVLLYMYSFLHDFEEFPVVFFIH